MKKFMMALLLLSGLAYGDAFKLATLNVDCSGSGHQVHIVSNSKGSIVTLDGETFFDDQLSAGTEGGGPYLQAVNNRGGYNITVSGGDLRTAFNDSLSIVDGVASASVNLFNQDEIFQTTCLGLFAF